VKVVAVAEGRNTLQSMQAVHELMQEEGWESGDPRDRPVALAAHPHDGPRLRHRGGADVARPGPARRCAPAARRSAYIARETLAYLYYKALGRSGESGPSAV
jgi:hypothetical protein